MGQRCFGRLVAEVQILALDDVWSQSCLCHSFTASRQRHVFRGLLQDRPADADPRACCSCSPPHKPQSASHSAAGQAHPTGATLTASRSFTFCLARRAMGIQQNGGGD
jgi:hypothetical protein